MVTDKAELRFEISINPFGVVVPDGVVVGLNVGCRGCAEVIGGVG